MLAAAGEAETEAEAEKSVRAPLRRKILGLLRDSLINPWCAICGAHRATWRHELRRTRYGTLAEAEPELRETEARNVATNRVWGDIHRTSKPN